MKRRATLFTMLIVVVLLSGTALRGQEANALSNLQVELFNLPNGKSGNHVQTIVQDQYGFMWFGSQYGLHRWDGHKFKTYVHSSWDGSSISSNYVETIYVAKDGSLWIGTWGAGLNHFQHETGKFKRYYHKERNENTISSNQISVITEDDDGHLWIGTQNGLDRMDIATGKIKRFKYRKKVKNTISSNQVRALHFDTNNNLWVGTGFPFFDRRDGGLCKYNPETETFTRYDQAKGLPNKLGYHVRVIEEDRQGRLWVGSTAGLHLFDRASGTFKEAPVSLNLKSSHWEGYPHMTFFYEDNRNRYWAGHFNAGVFCIDPSTQERVIFDSQKTTPESRRLQENAAWTICQSKDGVIWVTTAEKISRVYRIKTSGKVANNNIEPLPAGQTKVESTTEEAIVDRLKGSSIFQVLNEPETTGMEEIVPIENETAEEQLESKKLEVKTERFTWSLNQEESGLVVREDMATGERITYQLDQSIEQKGYWKSKPYGDMNGDFWICLENGLLKLDQASESGALYSPKQLGGKSPFKGMVMDEQGVLWLLGQSLLKFEPETERVFSFEDGIKEIDLPATADDIYINQEGNIVLETGDELHEFDPFTWQDSLNAPVLRITDFELLDLEDRLVFDSSQQAAFWDDNFLTLKYFQDAFFFRFAVMDFQSPELHKLEYKLENHDKNWREAEGDPRAVYANVPPGYYVFKVRGANQFGIWGDEATLGMVINAPWWKSQLAYLIYTLLALLLIYLIYRFQLNKRLSENETLRLKELHETKSKLYTNITHEFRTPLTIIMGMAKQIKEKPEAHLDKGLDLIHRNGEQLLGLVNQLLDLSKVEGGKMKLKPVQGDLVHFLKNEVEGMKSYAANKGLGLHFIPDMTHLDMSFDKEKMQKVLANLLSNAIKFTPAGGHVYVNLSANDKNPQTAKPRLTLKVRDTGKGIPAKELPSIFDRFYQVDGSATREGEGSGIGLSLTKEIIELMNGEIKVKSWKGAGTEFTIFLPIVKSQETLLVQSRQAKLVPSPKESKQLTTTTSSSAIEVLSTDTGQPTLLLIEDNPDVVAYLATCLEDQYTLLVGKDGQEGIEIAFERVPDIIITDVMMPRKDGFEVSQLLKTDQRTSHIPIIMLTAKADMASKLEGLEQGVDAYLSKPFNKEELLIRLKKLLELRQQLQRHFQSVAGLVIEQTGTNTTAAPAEETTKQEDYFVRKVRRSVESHLDDYEFNVEKLCRDVGMSHSQLHRKLSALTGLSANKYIRNIRLIKAKELLQMTPPHTITAVALDCGFNDPGYFGRVFKKEFGKTPLEWQEQADIQAIK